MKPPSRYAEYVPRERGLRVTYVIGEQELCRGIRAIRPVKRVGFRVAARRQPRAHQMVERRR